MSDTKSYKKSNFGGAFFFLSEDKKAALSNVYDFCRYADDIADDNHPDAPRLLKELREEIDLVFERRPQTGLGLALLASVEEYRIPKQYFIDLIEGVACDLQTPVRFDTVGDLKRYIYRVACVVGLMCIEIFGYTNPQTREYAQALGTAVQLTNIVRDIAADAKINRIYLPKEDMDKFGVSQEDILTLNSTRKVRALLMFELERAQEYYDRARMLLPPQDFKSMLAARAMGNIYKGILKKLQKNPCAWAGKKLKLNKLEKLRILFKTWRETP